MEITFSTFIGVEVSADKNFPFTYAAIDGELNIRALGRGGIKDAFAFLAGQSNALAGVNSPLSTNKGLIKREEIRRKLSPKSHLGRWANQRIVEFELTERGINIPKTPASIEKSPRWMRLGFRLFEVLRKMNYACYPDDHSVLQYFECQGEAAFWNLLGHNPLKEASLEGRLQRQMVLKLAGLKVPDAMQFFEEITRHKLLTNQLPLDNVYLTGELNALAAAYTAYLSIAEEGGVVQIGDVNEGIIFLPEHKVDF